MYILHVSRPFGSPADLERMWELDSLVENIVGSQPVETGCGFGARDMTFELGDIITPKYKVQIREKLLSALGECRVRIEKETDPDS